VKRLSKKIMGGSTPPHSYHFLAISFSFAPLHICRFPSWCGGGV